MTCLRSPRRPGFKIAHRHILADMALPARTRNARWGRTGSEQADGDIVRDVVHFILPDALSPERKMRGLPVMRSACLLPRVVSCDSRLTLGQRLDRYRSHALGRDARP